MSLPENVLRTRELTWTARTFSSPPPFAGGTKGFEKHRPRLELGFHLQEVPPGMRSAPLHDHLFEEEHFFVIDGTLTVTERTASGARRQFELRGGEFVAYAAGTRLAHAFSNRSAEPASFLAISELIKGDICTYPDSGKTGLRASAVGAWLPASSTPERDAAAMLAAARWRREREPVQTLTLEQRPSHVASSSLAEGPLDGDPVSGVGAALSKAAGARALFAQRQRLLAGAPPGPLHRHRFNETAYFVLQGQVGLRQKDASGESRCELVAGDLAHFPAQATAHQLWNAGSGDALVLCFGTDRPWNVIDLEERGELYARAFEGTGLLHRLDYYAGEAEGR